MCDFVFTEELKEKIILETKNLIPEDISEEKKNQLIERMETFSYVIGEVFWNDDFLNYSNEQKSKIVQLVSITSFKQFIRLIQSQIPQKYWDVIMQKIAFAMFEKSKEIILNNMDLECSLTEINPYIDNIYTDLISDLQKIQILKT